MTEEQIFEVLVNPVFYVVLILTLLAFMLGRKTVRPKTVCPTRQEEILETALEEISKLYMSTISDSEFGEKCEEIRRSWREVLQRLAKK